MEISEVRRLLETALNMKAVDIERFHTGIGNYVFNVTTAGETYILRCSKEKEAYAETIRLLSELATCNIPIPKVLHFGEYAGNTYLMLSYIKGNDIGNVYHELSEQEKRQIAKEVIAIQKKVSYLNTAAPSNWNWNSCIDEMIDRARERIAGSHHFDLSKIAEIRLLQKELQAYFDSVKPIPYLDDISTKNLLIDQGKVSGVIDIDWLGFGDMLTFVAMTKVALLNMELDTNYVDYLLAELPLTKIQQKAFLFYCLLFCIDFMGERGMCFLDNVIPVNA